MIILAIDVGKQGAYTVYDTEEKKYSYICPYKFKFLRSVKNNQEERWKSMGEVGKYFKELFINADVVVIGESFGQHKSTVVHYKYYGVFELLAEIYDAYLVYIQDNSARKEVLGPGSGAKKILVHEKYQQEIPDVSDCMLFTDWYLLKKNYETSKFIPHS